MIIAINAVPYGSTAKIMVGISEVCDEAGIENLTSTGYSTHPIKELPKDNIAIGGIFDKTLHILLSKLTGYNGCFSYFSTKRFLCKIDKFHPDTIHLHNLHGWYINLPALFKYIKKRKIRVVWTLHDCWAFTGQCPYFTMAKCGKWKTGCSQCPSYREYPGAFVDRTKTMWKLKKKWFMGVEDLTIVTPSQWLADLVKQSFLKNYSVKVINNGIDLSVFKPTESEFRTKYHCEEKTILLGVAFDWGKRKGLDVFIDLAKRLDDTYQIVLVGTNDVIDKELPDNIISIHRTQNQRELAEIYTAADLFVNPTREENYPTVNMESLACGTPVLTFRTGGSPEIIDETCGSIVEKNDNKALYSEILRITADRPYTKDACTKRATAFDSSGRFKEYVQLYRE